MKKNISHVTIMDSEICILSLLYRIIKNSRINPCEQYFIFVHCSEEFYGSKIRSLMNIATLSTSDGSEEIPISVIDIRRKEFQNTFSCGEFAFAKLNVILFDSFKVALKYFAINEVDLIFLGDGQNIIKDILSNKCFITPSIAMTTSASDAFCKYSIPFKFAEYFREVLFIKGKVNARIHMKQSLLCVEKETPTFSPKDIDDILLQFFSNIEKIKENNYKGNNTDEK